MKINKDLVIHSEYFKTKVSIYSGYKANEEHIVTYCSARFLSIKFAKFLNFILQPKPQILKKFSEISILEISFSKQRKKYFVNLFFNFFYL